MIFRNILFCFATFILGVSVLLGLTELEDALIEQKKQLIIQEAEEGADTLKRPAYLEDDPERLPQQEAKSFILNTAAPSVGHGAMQKDATCPITFPLDSGQQPVCTGFSLEEPLEEDGVLDLSLTASDFATAAGEEDPLLAAVRWPENYGRPAGAARSTPFNQPWGMSLQKYVGVRRMPADKCPSDRLLQAVNDVKNIVPTTKNYAVWVRMRDSVSSRHSIYRKLQEAERQVNRFIAYTEDKTLYGVRDYWALPSQIISRARGDCEDYAILKYVLLLNAGVPIEQMKILAVDEGGLPLHHAVLYVFEQEAQGDTGSIKEYILNNQKSPEHYDSILASQSQPYPIRVSVTAKGCVVYVKRLQRV